MKKITLLILVIWSTFSYSQDGYDEIYQFKKINSELKKHYDSNNQKHFFYKLISIKDDILKVEKFSYLPTSKALHVWKTLEIPMNEMDIKNSKYKKAIIIYTKDKKNIITTYTYKKTNPDEKKLNALKLYPRAGKEGDKEIMEMIITLFKNH